MNAKIRSLVFSLGALVLTGVVWGQEGAPTPKPTAEHERLAKDVGTWDATIKVWTQGPQSEPMVSHGTETNRMIPGGLWLISEFEGKIGDQPFHGHGLNGYDPRKKKYVGTWVDTMSTEIMVTQGEYDPVTNTVTMYAKGTETGTGKPYDAKMTTVREGDSRVFTMSMKSDETKEEFAKMMEITYKRRPK